MPRIAVLLSHPYSRASLLEDWRLRHLGRAVDVHFMGDGKDIL